VKKKDKNLILVEKKFTLATTIEIKFDEEKNYAGT
jgi:hypothetical protein